MISCNELSIYIHYLCMWNDLADPVIDGVVLAGTAAGLKSRTLNGLSCSLPFLSSTVFPFSSFFL